MSVFDFILTPDVPLQTKDSISTSGAFDKFFPINVFKSGRLF